LHEDLFAKSARSISELYAQVLPSLGIRHHIGSIQLNFHGSPQPDGRGIVSELVPTQQRSQECARLYVPPEFAAASAATRAITVLDVFHETLLCLGDRSGWDPALLHEARRQVTASGLVFTWTSPWRSSPDRRRRARVHYWLEPDGWGRAVLDIQRTADGTTLARSGPHTAYVSQRGFQRSADTMTWLSVDDLSFVPFVPPFAGQLTSVNVTVATHDSTAAVLPIQTGTLNFADAAAPSPVTVVDLAQPSHIPPIRVIGGGPMNGVNPTYEVGLQRALSLLETSPEWVEWWRRAAAGVLEVWYEFHPSKSGPWIRMSKHKVTARIIRSAASTHQPDRADAQGHQDVIDLMRAVAERVQRPDPPLHLLHPPEPEDRPGHISSTP
jgi:hypothetical protein